MRIIRLERLIDTGPFSSSATWREIEEQILRCLNALEWPPGAGKFLLHDQPGKRRGQGSGVKPIKDGFILCLRRNGWEVPKKLDIAVSENQVQSTPATEWATATSLLNGRLAISPRATDP